MQTPSHNDDAVEDGGNGNHHESFVSEVTCEEGTHSPYMNSPMNTYRSQWVHTVPLNAMVDEENHPHTLDWFWDVPLVSLNLW